MQLDCCIISLINNFKRKNLKDFPEGMIKFQERRAVRHAVVTRLYNACTLSCFKNAGVSCSWVKIQLNFLNFELTQGQARTLIGGGGCIHIFGACPTNFF